MWKFLCGIFLFGGLGDKKQSNSRMGDRGGCARGLRIEKKVGNSCGGIGQRTCSSLSAMVVV